jgi:biotin carboxyl carrier protein
LSLNKQALISISAPECKYNAVGTNLPGGDVLTKKKKMRSPQSTLRERLDQRAARRESTLFADPAPECKQIIWQNIPATMLQPMRDHIFEKTVAAIIVVICLGLFSLLNVPLTNRLVDAAHYLTVHQLQPAELVEAAKPVMQSVRDFNWRRTPSDEIPGTTQPEENDGIMVAPVNGVLTSSYGPRLNSAGEQMEAHYGIDVTTDPGAPVYAAFSGTVKLVSEHPVYGLTIYLEHPDNMVTIYGRVAEPVVAAGERVTRGQTIAVVFTPLSGDSHLHFEVWQNSEPVNPEDFLSDTD